MVILHTMVAGEGLMKKGTLIGILILILLAAGASIIGILPIAIFIMPIPFAFFAIKIRDNGIRAFVLLI